MTGPDGTGSPSGSPFGPPDGGGYGRGRRYGHARRRTAAPAGGTAHPRARLQRGPPGATGSGAPAGYGGGPGYGQPAAGPAASSARAASGSVRRSRPWGVRLGGALLDGVIALGLAIVFSLVSSDLARVANLALSLYFGYLTGTTGQTPGRRAVGTKVVRLSDGQVLGAGAGIGRAVLHVLDVLSLGLGYLWPVWDRKKQTFADKAIGSVVLKL